MVLGTTAHSCTFHSEGYRWLEPTTDPHAQRLSEICAGRGTGVFSTDSGASCSGENVDDGYFHMDLSQFGVEFPFMGKAGSCRREIADIWVAFFLRVPAISFAVRTIRARGVH